MKTLLKTTELQSTDRTPLKFFIVYADFEAGVHAKHFAEALAAGLGEATESTLSLWRCELLEIDELAAMAAEEAKDCDFMIVSLSGDTRLSFTTKEWIETWIEHAPNGASLVALFDSTRSVWRQMEATRFYLRGTAGAAGVVFFAHCAIGSNGARSTTDRAQRLAKPLRSMRELTVLAA